VLARFDDGTVALAEQRMGRGRIVTWGSSFDGLWNDLPRQAVFLPFLHQLAQYASSYRPVRSAYAVGEAVDLSDDDATARPTVGSANVDGSPPVESTTVEGPRFSVRAGRDRGDRWRGCAACAGTSRGRMVRGKAIRHERTPAFGGGESRARRARLQRSIRSPDQCPESVG
jgi:hypothetical protein